MKKTKIVTLLIIFALICCFIIAATGCQQTYTVQYTAEDGGEIVGLNEQIVTAGSDTQEVIAVAKEGYKFFEWSDGYPYEDRIDKNISHNLKVKALFNKYSYNIKYTATIGGKIKGNASQSVKYNENCQQIEAIANENFEFVSWSDGVTNPIRIDTNIKEDFKVEAIFRRIAGIFNYNYNKATENCSEKFIYLEEGKLNKKNLVVPIKNRFIFKGWYLDKEFNKQVGDEYGNIICDEIFDSDLNLFAKWEVIEKIEYNILMVYDTEVIADLKLQNGNIVNLNYKMSDIEQKVCAAITYQFSRYLNTIFDGLIIFNVDSYFTKVPLKNDSLTMQETIGMDGKIRNEYYLEAQNIKEILPIVDNYDCIFNSYSLDDPERRFSSIGGFGDVKYATIILDSQFAQTLGNEKKIDGLLDLNHRDWRGIVTGYAHEFAHTIEQGITIYHYHRALAEGQLQGINDVDATIAYLLNQLKVTNESSPVGVPYAYWKKEFYNIKYEAEKGKYGVMGYIETDWSTGWKGGRNQIVPKGENAAVVTAYPSQGYEFIEWSDGVKSATRKDLAIDKDFSVTAKFAPKTYDVIYRAEEGGYIQGETNQKVVFQTKSSQVEAIAREGYMFIGWSDGYSSPIRRDVIGLNEQAEVTSLEVTALFVKI